MLSIWHENILITRTLQLVIKETVIPTPFRGARKETGKNTQVFPRSSNHQPWQKNSTWIKDFLPPPAQWCVPPFALRHTLPKSVSKEYKLCRRAQKKKCKKSIFSKSQHSLNVQSRLKWTLIFLRTWKVKKQTDKLWFWPLLLLRKIKYQLYV